MKTKNSIQSLVKYSTVCALACSSTLLAIERPTPAAQPLERPSSAVPAEIPGKAIPIQQAIPQDTAFLGVFGEPISKTLSAHLNLADGIGIQLEIIAPNSPASNAGLQTHDIITGIAGKDISSIDDLQDAIADKKPGDEVTLNYISKGKLISQNIKLGARTIPRAERAEAEENPQLNQLKQPRQVERAERGLPEEFLKKFPKDDRKMLMKLFEGNLKGLDLQELQQGMGQLEGFDLDLFPKGLIPEINQGIKLKGDFKSRVKMLDKNGSITLESTQDGKIIELLDKDGKLQYKGPFNNQADKMNVPEELRERVENFDVNDGIGLFNPPNFNKLRDKRMGKNIREPLGLPNHLKGNNANNFNFKINRNGFSATRIDPATGNRYTLSKDDDTKQVEIYDPSGKLLYDGPYNSDFDKASVPEDFRDFIQGMDIHSSTQDGNKIELKLNR